MPCDTPYTVSLISKNLGTLQHGEEIIRLVQFAHDSPGLQGLRVKLGEAIAALIVNDPAALSELAGLHNA